MSPVAVVLERTLRATCGGAVGAQTPHEAAFTARYLAPLQEALAALRRGRRGQAAAAAAAAGGGAGAGHPPAVWDPWPPFAAIATSLAQQLRQHSVLRLADVSPALCALRGTHAPMPGLGARSGGTAAGGAAERTVTLHAMDAEVRILPTKTRPKKVAVTGSDGRRYTYLLKGREDLRLDERLMQFLTTVNLLLAADPAARQRGLRTRHYTVTPLSSRAGLIQWVEETTPLFSLYQAWQRRTLAAAAAAAAAVGGGGGPAGAPSERAAAAAGTRPTELFYRKVVPALKEQGLRRAISRKDWPVEVLRKVLVELMAETPRHVLRRELWVSSQGAADHLRRQAAFSRSVAVMSIVGWVLGLGDRHLDNLLLDATTGEVVHIDYNVCFDKGLDLKVPEIVPFRLTQTLQTALGVTGVEGTLRGGCEATLRVLRAHRRPLLALLEAFVFDPLVEWTAPGAGGRGAARKDMEVAVTLSLFVSRMQEMETPLQARLLRLAAALPDAEAEAAAARAALSTASAAEAAAVETRTRHGRAMEEAAALERERAQTLAEDAGVAQGLEAAIAFSAAARAGVAEAARECHGWCERHAHTLTALCGTSGRVERTERTELRELEAAAAAAAAAVATGAEATLVPPEGADVRRYIPPALLDTAAALDADGVRLLGDRAAAVTAAVVTLREYSTAVAALTAGGRSYVDTTAHHRWATALHAVSQQPTAAVAERELALQRPSRDAAAAAAAAATMRWEAYTAMRVAWGAGQRELRRRREGVTELQRGGAAAAAAAAHVVTTREALRLALSREALAAPHQARALHCAAAQLCGEWSRQLNHVVNDGGGGGEWCLVDAQSVTGRVAVLRRTLCEAAVAWPSVACGGGESGEWLDAAEACVAAVDSVMVQCEGRVLPALLAEARGGGGGEAAAAAAWAAAATREAAALVERLGAVQAGLEAADARCVEPRGGEGEGESAREPAQRELLRREAAEVQSRLAALASEMGESHTANSRSASSWRVKPAARKLLADLGGVLVALQAPEATVRTLGGAGETAGGFFVRTQLRAVHAVLSACAAEARSEAAQPGPAGHVVHMELYQRLRLALRQVLDDYLRHSVLPAVRACLDDAAARFGHAAHEESGGEVVERGQAYVVVLRAHCEGVQRDAELRVAVKSRIQSVVRLECLQSAREWDLARSEWRWERELAEAAESGGEGGWAPLEGRTAVPQGAPMTAAAGAPPVARRLALLARVREHATTVAAADEALVAWERRTTPVERALHAAGVAVSSLGGREELAG
jgi:hypothetical protein